MKVHCAIDVAFAVPGDIASLTGGYAYARQLMARLPKYGVQPHRLQLSSAFPFPGPADLTATVHLFAQLPSDRTVLVDGLAFGAMPASTISEIRQPLIALVHHPLAYETGLTGDQSRQLFELERQALGRTDQVITVSRATARLLETEYGVSADRLTVAPPGTEPAQRATGGEGKVNLLAVGAVIPRKNYRGLIEALDGIRASDWHLTIAGSTTRHDACVSKVREAIERSGLQSRISLTGEVSDSALNELYAQSDAFVMPSLFEGYGMVLCEASARGLPIVCTTAGAMSDTVPDAAALKVAPDDLIGLRDAIRRIIEDDMLRQRLADASWQAGQSLPTWDDCARKVADVIKTVSQKQ